MGLNLGAEERRSGDADLSGMTGQTNILLLDNGAKDYTHSQTNVLYGVNVRIIWVYLDRDRFKTKQGTALFEDLIIDSGTWTR